MNSIVQWISKKIKKEHIEEAIAWLIIFAILSPICLASSYVFFRADDFAEGILNISDRNGNFINLLIHSFGYIKEMYFTWMGTYFSKFMQMLLHPVNTGNGLMQLKLVMSGNTILFMASFGFFLYALVKENVEKRYLRIWLVVCGYIGVLGFQTWYEALYWYSGALCYSLPISLFFLAFAILMLEKKESIGRNIIVGILLFCGAGGNLAVVGAGCWLLIMITVNQLFQQKFRRKYVVLLIVTVIGALINVAAPGNYVRQALHDSGVHYIRAVIWSFDFMVRNCQWLFFKTPFLLFLIFAFLIGLAEGKRKPVNDTFVKTIVALSAIAPWIVGYPICLGYSTNVGLKNRCQFVIICVIVLCSINCALLLGKLIAAKVSANLTGEIMIAVIIMAIIMPSHEAGWAWDSFIPYKTLVKLSNGSIQEYYRDVNRIFESIASDQNEDVFVSGLPQALDIFEVIVFPEDPANFMNAAMANYYNKRSIQGVSETVYYGADTTYVRISPDSFIEDLSYVSIINYEGDTKEMIQKLKPFNKNLVIEIPAERSGTIEVKIYSGADGKTCIEKREISY